MKTKYKKIKKNMNFMLLIISRLKAVIISKMFWGRGNFYKNISHFLMISITIVVALGGIIYRVSNVNASQNKLTGALTIGSDDLLQQGGSISTVLNIDNSNASNLETSKYTVKSNDTLTSIAKNNNITIDTIRWANSSLINPFSNEIQPGWVLSVPKINGVLYKVQPNQTLDEVIKITSINNNESNKFNIVEFNNLIEPYSLTPGQQLFIPDGNLLKQSINVEGIPKGIFINPLSDQGCKGYVESRGFTGYHDGVDLAKWNGCVVEAVATGTVIYAGWENLSGNCVKIDHGGGIISYYYHAQDIYVKTGQRIQQGEPITFMGCTGHCTGTHLHFTIKKDNIAVDPALYVPF